MTEFLPARASASRPRVATNLLQEVAFTSRLGVPLAIGELGWMSTYIVDALMIGRLPHSALAISASSLGNTIFYALAFCAIGIFTGLETLTAQSYGRGDTNASLKTLAQSMWFVAVATPIVMGATLAAIPLLRYCGTPPEIISETSNYLRALIWSTPALLLYWAFRRYLQSVDRVLLIMISLVTASMVNFAGDWAFLFGHLGLKPMGIAGSAWGTCVVRLYTLVLLAIAVIRSARQTRTGFEMRLFRPDWGQLRTLFAIGWPAALQSLADLGVSTFLSIVCARLGATMLAAHQVVLDLNAFVYMVPLGLSYATITRAGQAAGRRSISQIRRAARASLLIGMTFIVVAATLFVSFPRFWASLYTNDSAAVTAAVPIFLLCGLLQISDAAGVILSGALVGLGDTRPPLWIDAGSSWLLGMPLAYWLTFQGHLGLRGLWLGRMAAAVTAAVLLAIFWRFRIAKLQSAPIPKAATDNVFPLRANLTHG